MRTAVLTAYERQQGWLAQWRPDTTIHSAQYRAAPCNLKTDELLDVACILSTSAEIEDIAEGVVDRVQSGMNFRRSDSA